MQWAQGYSGCIGVSINESHDASRGVAVLPMMSALRIAVTGRQSASAPFAPRRSRNALLDGLSDHFGEEASLPADKVDVIRAYLAANAGDAKANGIGRKYMEGWRPAASCAASPRVRHPCASIAFLRRCGRTPRS